MGICQNCPENEWCSKDVRCSTIPESPLNETTTARFQISEDSAERILELTDLGKIFKEDLGNGITIEYEIKERPVLKINDGKDLVIIVQKAMITREQQLEIRNDSSLLFFDVSWKEGSS